MQYSWYLSCAYKRIYQRKKEGKVVLQSRSFIGDALKDARVRSFLTQQALAERLGIEASHISRWERNVVVPSLHYQQKLTEVLGNFLPRSVANN